MTALPGMASMFKSMLGIDPVELQEQAKAVAVMAAARLENYDARLQRIEETLQRIESVLALAPNVNEAIISGEIEHG